MILIRYFARYLANIVTQMNYKLVNPWLPWQYGKYMYPRRSISTSPKPSALGRY